MDSGGGRWQSGNNALEHSESLTNEYKTTFCHQFLFMKQS